MVSEALTISHNMKSDVRKVLWWLIQELIYLIIYRNLFFITFSMVNPSNFVLIYSGLQNSLVLGVRYPGVVKGAFFLRKMFRIAIPCLPPKASCKLYDRLMPKMINWQQSEIILIILKNNQESCLGSGKGPTLSPWRLCYRGYE